MTSYSGSVAYLKYVSKTSKGGVKKGDEFNSVFGLGDMSDARRNFTAEIIIDPVSADGTFTAGLTPIVKAIVHKDDDGNLVYNDAKVTKADGTIEYVDFTVTDSTYTIADLAVGDKVAYKSEEFQMTHVPAQDIPTIGPKMEHIPLVAEPRRIAVRYDQITAFQAKTDYGFSLD